MRYLPIHIDTQGRKVLVAGGGRAAEAKLRTLAMTEADVTVFSGHVSPEIMKWADDAKLHITRRNIVESDILSGALVYAATEDEVFNSHIAQWARDAGALVNAADQRQDCDFHSPAVVDRSPVVVSIGTEGTAPGLARRIKADIEARLPSSLGDLSLKIKALREKLARTVPKISDRQAFWARLLGGHADAVFALSSEELEGRFETALKSGRPSRSGRVALVGAGPGDPDLLTIQARNWLNIADVVIYDRLVTSEVLALARREAEFIYVGKEPGKPSTKQSEINDILIGKAKEGGLVVRLKSGDPLIFGRADEEIEALLGADIVFEVVSGITSASAAAATIGASLTTRGHNSSLSFITGHDTKGYAEHDWKVLAEDGGRAAVYMGVGASRFIQGRLMLHGVDPRRPVTVIENASRREQIILSTEIGCLAEAIEAAGINGPAILLLGYAPRKTVDFTFTQKDFEHERQA